MSVPIARLGCCLIIACAPAAFSADASQLVLEVTATVEATPPRIRLSWPADGAGTGYTIQRKLPSDTGWSNQADLAAGTTGWTDSAISVGTSYEYSVRHGDRVNYIASGIDVPVVDARGAVVLLVESGQAAALASELARLVDDLRGDGWQVLRHDVPATSAPPAVKALILADRAANPQVTSVLIVGHVAVPYSGDLYPDGHPEHRGAWPADTYYADLAGTWTDSTVNTTSADRTENDNVPGDGKFDQTLIPSGSALVGVGRIDCSNMPAFADGETELLRRYLDRDHAWRTGQVAVQRKALVDDNFVGAPFAENGWRLTSLVGAGNVAAQDWFGTLRTQSYLFAYGCGGGSLQSAGGVGSTGDFASGPSNAVFTMMWGSWFGDWDNRDALLRAPLAGAGLGLTCTWSGFPSIALHRMGMGATIGEVMAANLMGTTYPPGRSGAGNTYQGLMGDPTLRLHPLRPPTALAATTNGRRVSLAWSASSDAGLGYHVYRASGDGAFARITMAPISATTYDDDGLAVGAHTYQVRAIRREIGATGTYLNNSQGAQTTAEVVAAAPSVVSLSATSGPTAGGTAVTITGTGFADATAVTFAGNPASSVVVVDATTITCVTPPGTAGLAAVAVTTPAGNGTLAAGFRYVDPGSPGSGGGAGVGGDGGGGGKGCGLGNGMALLLGALALGLDRRRRGRRIG